MAEGNMSATRMKIVLAGNEHLKLYNIQDKGKGWQAIFEDWIKRS